MESDITKHKDDITILKNQLESAQRQLAGSRQASEKRSQ